ncbi:hypothetical protein Tco_0657335 [Tanacetum coccineum]|uniref:Uncharacterized protein n=1 Tax=Tanacetum coccineum TaxID=301880 RepID=A0ABQ4XCL6_9ASTR
MYDMAESHCSVDLFFPHKPQKLTDYYLKNLCLEGSDEGVMGWAEEYARLRCLSSTPLRTRPFKEEKGGCYETVVSKKRKADVSKERKVDVSNKNIVAISKNRKAVDKEKE